MIHLDQPDEAFCFHLQSLCIGEQSFYFLLNRWLLAFINQLFAIFAESINDFTVSFQWRKYWLGFKFAKNISDIEIIRRGENSNFGDIFVGYMYT